MNRKIFADLHNHTTASDGDFTPEQIVVLAKSLGIKAIGVTDHDTLSGLKTAIKMGKRCQVDVIPGVEVSIRFKRPYFIGTLHLLCYFRENRCFDDSFVNEFNLILSRGRGEKLVRARVAEINHYFGPDSKAAVLNRDLTYDDIAALSTNASRRHFALALQSSFGITRSETINALIGNESPAYLPSGIDLDKITAFIRENKILCVLAHPAAGSFPGKGHYKEVLPPLEVVERIFPEFINAGIRGLEVYYPGHIAVHQELMKTWCETHHLLVTGGSDCHDRKDRPLGVKGITEPEYKLFKAALK